MSPQLFEAPVPERSAKQRDREEATERQRRYRQRYPERSRETSRRYYQAHPEVHREWQRKHPDKNRKGTARREGYVFAPTRPEPSNCELCGEVSEKRLHYDHDHASGEFRGWLCGNCNRALGLFRDNPLLLAAAIRWVEQGGLSK